MSELKPCPVPWCESTDISVERENYEIAPREYFATCNQCTTTGPMSDTEAGAAAAWNTRTPAVPVEVLSDLFEPQQFYIDNPDALDGAIRRHEIDPHSIVMNLARLIDQSEKDHA